jgi:hypothetical protein
MMTSRERIEAALNHRAPDRTPIFEYVLRSPIADALLGRPYAADPEHWPDVVREKGWQGAVQQAAADRLDLALLLGHDMMYVEPNPPSSDEGRQPAADLKGVEDAVERVRMRNERAASSPPPSDDILLIYTCLADEMKARGVDLPILAPAYAHGVWTDTDLMQTMLLAPEVAQRHFSIATRHALALIEKYLSLGVEQIGVGGDFSGTRPLVSPEAYRRFIVPEVRVLSRRIHDADAYAINASDGNLWPVIDDFLFGCEVDGYLEIDVHAGMELADLKAICRGRITLYGNLDCGNVLSFGSQDDVRRHTISCIEAGMGDGGHILCASNAVTASVPLDNYLAVVNAYRDTFGLPRLALGR